MSQAIFVHGHVWSDESARKKNFGRNTTPSSETCCHRSFSIEQVITVVAVSLPYFGHVYVAGLGRACPSMIRMAEGDPAMVISTAAMGGRAGESQMRFHTEVALSDQTGCFIV